MLCPKPKPKPEVRSPKSEVRSPKLAARMRIQSVWVTTQSRPARLAV